MLVFSKVWGLQHGILLLTYNLVKNNSFTGIVLVFFLLLIWETPILRKISWWVPPFYVNCETRKTSRKPLKNRTDKKIKKKSSQTKSFASNSLFTSQRNIKTYVFQALLMKIEKHSEHCYTTGAYDRIYWLSSFKMIL